MKKRLLCYVLTMALCMGLIAMPAVAAEQSPAASRNINGQDYTSYAATTVKSYLFENEDGGLTRVEYDRGQNIYTVGSNEVTVGRPEQIIVETYDADFQLLKSFTIEKELPIWGGFFAGENYNFFVFGQQNLSESDSAEVIRVVKYSKDWQRLGQASLRGANTTVPFDAGSLRMDEYDGELYIRTSHEMYTSSDGLNHQANLTLCVDQEQMTVLDSYYRVMNSSVGYVSHSFNQFVLVDQEQNIVTLDQGDAYPRAAVLMKYAAKAGDGKFSGSVSSVTIQSFPGQVGYNTTGASMGGLTETSGGYVVAFNYNGTGSNSPVDRTVYLAYVPKGGSAATVRAISSAGATTPQLVSTGLNGGYVLWNGKDKYTVNDTLYYASYDNAGNLGAVQTAAGSLSDCAPIYYNGKVVWYTTDDSAPVFYQLDGTGVTATPLGDSGQPAPTPVPTPTPTLTPTPTPIPTPTPTPQVTPNPGSDASGFLIGGREEYLAYWEEHRGTGGLINYDMPEDAKILIRYTGDGGNVLIPEGITHIGNGAFYDCDGLTSVVIPDGVVEIGDSAFFDCENLSSVVIPEGVTTIEMVAFAHCFDLTSIDLPDSITSIRMRAFFNCSGLTSITIPEGVTEIAYGTFQSCRSMTSATIPASVTKIGGYAFYDCGELDDVYFGGTEAQWNAIDLTGEWHPRVRIHFAGDTEDNTGNNTGTEQPSEWARDYVQAAVAANLVPENLQSKYTQATTRGEFCALAVQLYETVTGGTVTGRSQFVDTSDVNVEKAAALGVIKGVGNGRANPNGDITREQAAVMLARLAEVCGNPLPAEGASFADSGAVSDWAADAVDQVASNEIMNGTGNNSFSPKGQYTREQSITTMLRLFNLMK